MLTADEAVKATIQSWSDNDIDVLEELEKANDKIKLAVSAGYFGANLHEIPLRKAEKLAWELEEFGYKTTLFNGKAVGNEAYVDVCIDWKTKSYSKANKLKYIS